MNPIKTLACLGILQSLFLDSYNCSTLFYNKHVNKYTDILPHETTSTDLPYDLNEFKNIYQRENCGKSLNHLGGLLLDKADEESKLTVEGSITNNNLILKIGKAKEKQISIKKIHLPIETISKKCMHIREKLDGSSELAESFAVICLNTKLMRNLWINSITDAVLCNLTNLKGKLPEYNHLNEEEEEKEENGEEKEVEEKKEKEEKKEAEEKKEEEEKKEVEEKKEKEEEKKEKEETKKTEETTEKEQLRKDNEEEIKGESVEMKEGIYEAKQNEQREQEKTEDNEKVEVKTDEKKNDELKTEDNKIAEEKAETITSEKKQKEELKKKMLQEEYDEDTENEREKKGINVRISKGVFGYPKIKINGNSLDEMEEKENNSNASIRGGGKESSEQTTEETEELEDI